MCKHRVCRRFASATRRFCVQAVVYINRILRERNKELNKVNAKTRSVIGLTYLYYLHRVTFFRISHVQLRCELNVIKYFKKCQLGLETRY